MKIENLKVYDLADSIIASGYPLRIKTATEEDYENLKKCLDFGLVDIINILDNGGGHTCSFKIDEDNDCVSMSVGNSEKPVLIDFEDLPRVARKGWTYNASRGYIQSTGKPYIEIQRFLVGEEGYVVDHENRDVFDNRKSNLRLATGSQNTHNRGLLNYNKSGIIGVYYSNSKKRWISSIEINGKVTTRSFKDKESAIRKRLELENDLLGEFSPQKHLFELYGIEKSWEEKNCKKLNFIKGIKDLKRAMKLGNSKLGSGHSQFLIGIRVAFDLTFSEKAWTELQRYHFIDFVSSCSCMHCITKFDIKSQCNKYVWDSTIEKLQNKCNEYNNLEDKNTKEAKELYLEILYNIPTGFQLTARMTTNYSQIRTMVEQRHNHRLPEWREFCDYMIDNLPLFKELCLKVS